MQFDRAEFTAPPPGAAGGTTQPGVTTCAACQNPITGNYYAAGEHVFCPSCREQILASMTGGSAARRFFRAVVFGVLAGLLGALLWYAVRKLTGYEVGLIAVVVGWAVGAAVRKGSSDRGGIGYQILAAIITYCCIVTNYVPDVYAEISKEHGDAPLALLLIFSVVIAFLAPVLAGLSNIIGMLIIGFALWEAWRINKFRKMEFQGPFTIAGAGAGGSAAPTPPGAEAPGLAVASPRWSDASPSPPPPSNTPPPPPPPSQLGMT